MVRRWPGPRPPAEKRAALIEALRGHTVEEAAEALGLTPRHVYRLKQMLLTGRQGCQHNEGTEGTEGMTSTSLRDGDHGPTFAPVASMAIPETEELEGTKVHLPLDVKRYLQHRAVETGGGRPSMSRVIVELVRREMARERGSNG